MYSIKNARVLGLAGILFVSGVTAFAQANPGARGPGGGRQRGGNRVSLATLPIEAIDAIVKLTPDEKTKIAAIQADYAKNSAPLRPMRGQPADPNNRMALAELTRKATTDIEATMTQEQKDKLTPAMKTMGLLMTFGLPAGAYPDLKLTDDQITKLTALAAATREKTMAQGADRRAITADARAQAEALLTADQKTALENYIKAHPMGAGRRRANPPPNPPV